MRRLIIILLFSNSLAALAQPAQAPLQSFTSGGVVTGGSHPSTAIPTHISSFGQPMIMRREAGNQSGSGGLYVTDIMFPDLPPQVANQNPANNSVAVPTNASLVLTFDEPVAKNTGDILIRQIVGGNHSTFQTVDVASSSVSVTGNAITITHSVFPANTNIYVIIPNTAIRDLTGNIFEGYSTSVGWLFTTATTSDSTPPALSGLTPTNNATNVPINSSLTITFNEPVLKGTGNIQILRNTDLTVVEVIDITGPKVEVSGATASINPDDFGAGVAMHVIIPGTGFKDIANNTYAGFSVATAWTFTTASGGTDTTPPTISSQIPAPNSTGILVSDNLSVTFSETVQKGTTGVVEIRRVSNNSLVGSSYQVSDAAITVAGAVMTINPSSNLPYDAELYVFIAGTFIQDVSQNVFSGIATPATWSFRTQADTDRPTLTGNTSDTFVNAGSIVNIKAQFSDPESGVASASVTHRKAEGTTWTTTPLTLAGSEWSTTLIGANVGTSGLEYKLEATNGAGLVYTSSSFIVKVSPANNGLQIPYTSFGDQPSDFRIFAVPLDLDGKTVANVFTNELGERDNKKWRVARYEGTTTQQTYAGNIVPGWGYWLIIKDQPASQLFSGPGKTVTATSVDHFDITLQAGWNQIGNPFTHNISWDDVKAANPGLGKVYRYNTGEWKEGDRLLAMEGGFVQATTSGPLNFPVLKNPSVNKTGDPKPMVNPIDDANWEVNFVLEQGYLRNLISGFGMREDASGGPDEHDGFSLPRFADYLEINYKQKLNGYHYAKNVVPTVAEFAWEFSIASSLEDRDMRLTWDNSFFGDNDKELVLWDVNLQNPINMRESNGYIFERGVTKDFKVLFGNRDFIEENTQVSDLVLHQVFPNPAEGTFTVAFSVPSDEFITVELLDMMGKNTARFFEGALSKGHHQVVCDQSAAKPAPGLYLVAVRSGGTTRLSKLIVR